ncbi:MAG: thioredoxin family protein [Parachlamydiaceae bacterium]
MRNAIYFIIAILGCVTNSLSAHSSAESIAWLTNYEQAVDKAKSESKPIILFFTGTGWCHWCNKLEKEVFDTPEFSQLAGDKYVFLKLDFPQPYQPNAQNDQLKKKYKIRGFPTLIILDSTGQQQIGMTDYRPGGPRQYADHLKKMVETHSSYKEKLQRSQTQKLSGTEIRKLYQKSKELNLPNDTSHWLKIGMESELKIYFLTERYRFLAEEGLIHDKEAVAIKQQLLVLDPKNEQHVHYDVAVIEFDAYSEEKGKNKDSAVEPLLEYIHKFGTQDRGNLWRLEMIVSQVYLDKNQLTAALQHAQASYDASPVSVQNEIASAIKNIQSQLNATR